MRQLLALVLVLAVADHAEAQAFPEIEKGTRVRVTAPTVTTEPIVGKVSNIYGDTLVVAPGGGRGYHTLPLVAVTELEVSRGCAGATAGWVIGHAMGSSLSEERWESIGLEAPELIVQPDGGVLLSFSLDPPL